MRSLKKVLALGEPGGDMLFLKKMILDHKIVHLSELKKKFAQKVSKLYIKSSLKISIFGPPKPALTLVMELYHENLEFTDDDHKEDKEEKSQQKLLLNFVMEDKISLVHVLDSKQKRTLIRNHMFGATEIKLQLVLALRF